MKFKTKLLLILLVLVFILSSCGGKVISPQIPEVDLVVDWADTCQEVYAGQIAAWDSREADQLREVYTEDIVHFDGGTIEGIDDVVFMARTLWMFLDDWGMEAGRTYISESDCFGVWANWGFGGFTEDNPRMEYDLVDIEDGKIYFWRLFYDEDWDFEPINFSLLENFAAGWSSGDSLAVSDLYAEDALLEDSLFGISGSGMEEIQMIAGGFWKEHPSATWELVASFSEGPNPNQPDFVPADGGIYQVTSKRDSGENCRVEVAVILTPDLEGRIANQQTMYSAYDLIECGWIK